MSAAGRGLDREDGTVTLWLLGLAVVVLFVGGLSVDLWRIAAERRDLAGAVDGAAVAGASSLDVDAFRRDGHIRLDPIVAADVACAYLRLHTDPPSPCDGVRATAGALTVSAERDVAFTLLRTLLPDLEPMRVRATATVEPRGA